MKSIISIIEAFYLAKHTHQFSSFRFLLFKLNHLSKIRRPRPMTTTNYRSQSSKSGHRQNQWFFFSFAKFSKKKKKTKMVSLVRAPNENERQRFGSSNQNLDHLFSYNIFLALHFAISFVSFISGFRYSMLFYLMVLILILLVSLKYKRDKTIEWTIFLYFF